MFYVAYYIFQVLLDLWLGVLSLVSLILWVCLMSCCFFVLSFLICFELMPGCCFELLFLFEFALGFVCWVWMLW